MTDLLIEPMSDYHFQENIMHPLQIVCRQLSNILVELRQWGKQHRSFNEECKKIDCRCSTHNIRCHSSSEPQTDGCDSLKLTSKLAEGTEPKLPYSNPGSRDALFQLFNGSAEETECKCPYSNPSLRDNPIHLASGPNDTRDIKFPHCDQGPRDVTDQEAQHESISQKIEENKSDLNDRYCLSKAIQKNLTLLIDALPYRGSELPDYLGEECLTDNENSRIRGNEQREDQIRLLLRTIMGRSFCDMKHFLDFARKFNPDEVDNVWKTYDELKREGNVEKRCIICLVMAYVDIKYVADIMYEKDLIPDSLFGRASDCKGSFGCQSKLWKELCRLFHHCICKDAMVETLINALEKKSKYRYLAEELRRCDGQVFATLKCRCETTQQFRKKYSQCTRQTRPVLSVRTGPRGSSSGTTSPSPWSSYSDISSGWNRNADIRRSSCFRRKVFAQFYKRGRSLHHNKRQQKDNTETAAKSPCNSNNEMFERYTTLECPKSSIISSLQSSHEDMVHNDAYDSQIPSKRMPFQDYVPTTHYYNSRVCEGDGFNYNDEAVLPKGLQKMLSVFLKDVMHFSEYQKDMSVGGDRSMTPDHNNLLATGIISNCSCSLTSGQIQTNKTMSTSTVETISSQNISSIQTSYGCENKQRQASEAFCSANQSGERIKYEMKTHMETEEEEQCVISNSMNEEEQCVISNGMNEEEQCVISNDMNEEEQCVLSNGMNQEEQCVISNGMNQEEQCVLSNGMNQEEQCVISNGMNQEEQCVISNGMNQEEQCVISNGMNEEKFTIASDNESDLLDTETSNSIAKTENEVEKMLITSSGQNRLQSKRPSLTRGLAIDSIRCNMKNDSSKTEETLSNVDESEAGILPGSINNGDSNNAHAKHLLK